MSPGTEADLDSMFLAQTASNDYEELYRMDVLMGGTKHAFLGKETTLPYLRMNLGA